MKNKLKTSKTVIYKTISYSNKILWSLKNENLLIYPETSFWRIIWKKYWFSFIELIVWITISMILMLSISVFVQNWIKNLTLQQNIIQNDIEIKDFTKAIYENLDFWNKLMTWAKTISWIYFRTTKNFDYWWFSYLWEKSFSWFYCNQTWANLNTTHLILKNFIPFEWEWWDIFSWYNFNNWWIITNIFSWSINWFTWGLFWPTWVAFWAWNDVYISDTFSHNILKFDKSNVSDWWVKIAWTWIFWDDFSGWTYWTWIFLNNPTWLSYSTIWSTWYLFISDTLNDRILYLNTSNYKIYKILWRDDWLSEPTWLYYNDSEKTMYISNSWLWEILTYSATWSFNNSINLEFRALNTEIINKIQFEFIYESWSINPSISTPSQISNFNFSWITPWEDLTETWSNNLIYHFVTYSASEILIWWCISWKYMMLWLNPIKCTNTWTWIIWTHEDKSIISWNNYTININNITWTNFSNIWNYYIKMNLIHWSTLLDSYYFPYFTKWDNDIFSRQWNTLKILTWWLWYPTWIYPSWTNLKFNDFLQRNTIEISKTWSFIWFSALSLFNFENLPINKIKDIILKTPISSYDFSIVNNLINIYIKYYKNYSCFWDESINSTKELIFKKNIN